MKHLISLIAATLVAFAPLQAQLFNKLKEKVNNAVKNSANKAVDKTIDKTVSKPIDNTVNKQLDNIGEKKSSGNMPNNTGGNKPETTGTTAANTATSGNIPETPLIKENFAPEKHAVNRPRHLAIDSKDNLYVTDAEGVVKITPEGSTQRITGFGASAIIIDSHDNIYLTTGSKIHKMFVDDSGACKVAYYSGDQNYNSAGDGDLPDAKFNSISSITVAKNGDIYIADNAWYLIQRKLNTSGDEMAMEPGVPEKLKQTDRWYYIRKISNGKVTSLKNKEGKYLMLFNVCGIAVDEDENIVYSGGGFSRAVKKLDTKNCTWQTIAGKPYKRQWCPEYIVGDTSEAELFDPGFILFNNEGNLVYSDNRNHRITQIAAGKVSTLAGNNIIDPCSSNIGGRAREGYKDGKAQAALFNFPKSMVYDSKGNLFIADSQNSIIRKLSPDGSVSSVTPFDKAKANISNYY